MFLLLAHAAFNTSSYTMKIETMFLITRPTCLWLFQFIMNVSAFCRPKCEYGARTDRYWAKNGKIKDECAHTEASRGEAMAEEGDGWTCNIFSVSPYPGTPLYGARRLQGDSGSTFDIFRYVLPHTWHGGRGGGGKGGDRRAVERSAPSKLQHIRSKMIGITLPPRNGVETRFWN